MSFDQEKGHQYGQEQLIALGAPRPRPGCVLAIWLREALAAVGARSVRHRGAHRFCGQLARIATWLATLPEQRTCHR